MKVKDSTQCVCAYRNYLLINQKAGAGVFLQVKQLKQVQF